LSFLAPLFLLASAALAIPLLLHLFRRREGQVQSFPALRYLRKTSKERRRIVRLRQLLLLILRLAVIALLVLAGARLVLPLGGGDQPPAGIAIVLDNGIQTSRVVDDRRVLDHLVDMALDALDRMGPDDRIWIVPAGEPWRPALPLGREEARRRIGALEPTSARSDLPRAVARAASLVETGAAPPHEILVLSDLEPSTFPDASPSGPAGTIPTVVGSPALEPGQNRGISEVLVGGGLPPRAGIPIPLAVQLAGVPIEDQAVRIVVSDELVAAGRTDGGGRLEVELPPAQEGWLTGRIELEPDELRADDVAHFTLSVRSPPRVSTTGPLTRFLEAGLDLLDERGRVQRTSQDFGVAIETTGVGATGRHPTLILPPADPTGIPAMNRRLEALGAGWRFQLDEGTPSTRTMDDADPRLRLPEGLQVHRSFRLEAVEGEQGTVLARLSDGTPWIAYSPGSSGSGQDTPPVLLVASPPDTASSDLPTSAAMIPFLSAALELLDGAPPTLSVVAGTPLPLPPGAHTVENPEGTPLPVGGRSSLTETGRTGIYRILDLEGELLGQGAVTPPPPSSILPLSPDDAAVRLGEAAVGVEGPRAWARSAPASRRGREVWRPLLAFTFLLLLAEGWLAARRDRDRPARNEPADLSS
jgi:hypothetical protein